MNDLISRQAAINAVFESAVGRQMLAGHKDIITILKYLPSAQPEIIRCKDCVHNFEGLFRCDRVTFYNEKDDFCSKAKMKRRDEENESN